MTAYLRCAGRKWRGEEELKRPPNGKAGNTLLSGRLPHSVHCAQPQKQHTHTNQFHPITGYEASLPSKYHSREQQPPLPPASVLSRQRHLASPWSVKSKLLSLLRRADEVWPVALGQRN